MARSSDFKLVFSSAGVDANGQPVVSPVSLLLYTDAGDGKVYSSLATDTVRFAINPLWAKKISDVSVPNQSILDHVPMNAALIRHWLKHDF